MAGLVFRILCCCLVTKLGPIIFCNPMDCSPPRSSVHGIPQARILEWVAISFSRGSFQLRDQTHISCISRQILYHWATRYCLTFSVHWQRRWIEGEKKTTEFSVIWGKRPYNLTWGKEHVHPSLSSAILKIFLACRNSRFTNFVFNPEKFLGPKEPNRPINKPPTHKGGGRWAGRCGQQWPA